MGTPSSLQMLKDMLSKAAHGLTKEEAIRRNICIHCKKPIHDHELSSPAGIREYQISGIYGDQCWDAQFPSVPEDEADEPTSDYTNQDPDLKAQAKTPYPEFCDRPECRGLSVCPKDPTCAD